MALFPQQADQPLGSPGTTNSPGILDSIASILDPSGVRLKIAGLFNGGASSNSKAGNAGQNIISQARTPNSQDWRVRLSLAGTAWNNFVGDPESSLMSPLIKTAETGVVFPYTPSISVTHNARYQEQALTHSNYKNYFYEGSDVAAITISGDFTVQNLDEGQYLLAAIYFFRTCTKMFYGNDTLAGNPPPLVFLDGYGDFYFPHVSCIITSFQHTMPADCDYIEIPLSYGTGPSASTASGKSTRLPTTSQISVTVQPVYSRKNMYNNFSLNNFAQGKLLSGKGGFI